MHIVFHFMADFTAEANDHAANSFRK